MSSIVSVVGTRPQFIKAAVICTAVRRRHAQSFAADVTHQLVHTGQHYDEPMARLFFEELDIPEPDLELEIGSGSHAQQTARILERLEPFLSAARPDWVLVYGDTNSTLGAALTAAKLQIPVAHVEAGLRSGNRAMPEEINRILVDQMSSALFCPTETAVENLAREGITRGVHLVGDVMRESVTCHADAAASRSQVLQRLGLGRRDYAFATIHRAANTDDPVRLAELIETLGELAAEREIVWPIHPRTLHAAERAGLRLTARQGLRVIPPVSYLDALQLVSQAAVVLTDSGGVQREAYWLSVPCITLRDETEWPETVSAGWNRLTGATRHRIRDAFEMFTNGWTPPPPAPAAGPASHQILDLLVGTRGGIE